MLTGKLSICQQACTVFSNFPIAFCFGCRTAYLSAIWYIWTSTSMDDDDCARYRCYHCRARTHVYDMDHRLYGTRAVVLKSDVAFIRFLCTLDLICMSFNSAGFQHPRMPKTPGLPEQPRPTKKLTNGTFIYKEPTETRYPEH